MELPYKPCRHVQRLKVFECGRRIEGIRATEFHPLIEVLGLDVFNDTQVWGILTVQNGGILNFLVLEEQHFR